MFNAMFQMRVKDELTCCQMWQIDNPRELESTWIKYMDSINAKRFTVAYGDTSTRYVSLDSAFPEIMYILTISI